MRTLILALLVLSGKAFGQQPDFISLQAPVRAVVDKVAPSVVSLSLYDSTSKRQMGGMFSGVVINAEGLILTAAHAAFPNKVYKVIFPDGTEAVAKGLGRISSVDAAMVQIMGEGNWLFSEMGTSSTLQTGEPCISMGYPGSLMQKAKPVVRFGYIGEPLTAGGYIRSTCLMEPGDSGGPLFDLNGRVIGIHSRIDKALENNFEIPVDAFRKYWHSLLVAESYDKKRLPLPETISPDFIIPAPVITVAASSSKQIAKIETKLNRNSLSISSKINGQAVTILGTIITLNGVLPEDSIKGYSFIISKSSMVGDTATIDQSKSVATIVSRDDLNDLVLLKVPMKNKYGVDILSAIDTLQYYRAGQFLFSPGAQKNGTVSVLGSSPMSMLRRSNGAFLGIGSELKEGAVVLTMVNPRSAASEAKLEIGDKVVSINGMVINETEDIVKVLSTTSPKDTILFTGIRQDSLFVKSIVLQARSSMPSNHIAEFFEDGKSTRRDGFKSVLVHDGKIKPSECGGPLFDTDGLFLGINIARLSRTSALAIPSIVIQHFLKAIFLATSI